MIELPCNSSKVKKKFFLPLFFPNDVKVQEVRYIWYQSQVETLGTNWAENTPTCLTLELHVY